MTPGLKTPVSLLESLSRRALYALIALWAVIALGTFTGMDEVVQDLVFNKSSHAWMVSKDNVLARVVFYDGPKVGIIITAVLLLVFWCKRPPRLASKLRPGPESVWAALVVLVATVTSVAAVKAVSNIHCPLASDRYGGDVPHHRLFEKPAKDNEPVRRGRCFPAGHASGGFGLVGLVWLVRGARRRRLVLCAALGLGCWMGGYQMAKGAHYLSHTLVTALWACGLSWSLGCWVATRRMVVVRRKRRGNLFLP